MATWFRYHTAALNHPKVQRLPPHLFKFWVNILCVASTHEGVLPDTGDLAYMLRRREGDVRRDVAALLARRLLDTVDGKVVPHDWDDHQYKSDVSTQRVRDHRKRSKPVTGNVPCNDIETPPDTDSETDTDTETEQSRKKVRVSDSKKNPLEHFDEIAREFDEIFWPAYPNKKGKKPAKAAFIKSRKATSLETIMAGLQDYCDGKPSERPWLHAATFINQERFNDEYNATIDEVGKKSRYAGAVSALAGFMGQPSDAPSRGHHEGPRLIGRAPSGSSENHD